LRSIITGQKNRPDEVTFTSNALNSIEEPTCTINPTLTPVSPTAPAEVVLPSLSERLGLLEKLIASTGGISSKRVSVTLNNTKRRAEALHSITVEIQPEEGKTSPADAFRAWIEYTKTPGATEGIWRGAYLQWSTVDIKETGKERKGVVKYTSKTSNGIRTRLTGIYSLLLVTLLFLL